MSVDSDWYEYIRDELFELEERADGLTGDVEANRDRLGPDLAESNREALAEVHRRLEEASEQLTEARNRLQQLQLEGDS